MPTLSPIARRKPPYPDHDRMWIVPVLVLLAVVASLLAGCAEPQADTSPAGQQMTTPEKKVVVTPPAPVPGGFTPARIAILPLTDLVPPAGSGQGTKLNVYVALLDAFGSQIKAPGTLRFELYRYTPRSAEPKGERINIWPDTDLTHPAVNHAYWRDYLRAYEFRLDAPAVLGDTTILEATCICPEGGRLSATFTLRPGK